MKPLAAIKVPIMTRITRTVDAELGTLAKAHGLRKGPFVAMTLSQVAKCPPDRFLHALRAFAVEAAKGSRPTLEGFE